MTAMYRHARILVILSAVALFAAACSKTVQDRLSPANWELSTEATSTYYYLLLEDAKRQNNSTVGEYALENLLGMNGSPTVYIEAANFYWHQGDADRTRQVLVQGLQHHPRSQELELMLAQLFLADKDLDQAAATIKSYLSKNPEDHLTRQELADILIRSEQYTQALELLEEIPEQDLSAVILYFRAKANAGLGRRATAIELLRRALDLDSGLIEAWAELAYIYELERDFGAAEAAYTRMLDMGESSQELWLRLVDLNLKLGRPDRALALTRRGPQELSFALGAGTLFVDYNQFKHAEDIFLPLLESAPEAQEVNFYLALLAFRGDKDLKKAIALLERVPETNRFHSRALRFRAHLLYETGDKAGALDLARQGRELFSEDKDFWTLEAGLHEEERNYDQALGVLSQALEQWPQDPELLFLFGVILDKKGSKADALEIMEQVVAQDPQHADALNYLGYTLADENRDLERAHQLIVQALNLKPDNGYIQDSLAWVHYRLGNLEAAWAEIQRAVANADSDPIIWEHYGDIAAALGNREAARKGYTKALQFAPKNPADIEKKLRAL